MYSQFSCGRLLNRLLYYHIHHYRVVCTVHNICLKEYIRYYSTTPTGINPAHAIQSTLTTADQQFIHSIESRLTNDKLLQYHQLMNEYKNKSYINDTDKYILFDSISSILIDPQLIKQFKSRYIRLLGKEYHSNAHINTNHNTNNQNTQYNNIIDSSAAGVSSDHIPTPITELRSRLQFITASDAELFDRIVSQVRPGEIDTFVDIYNNFVNGENITQDNKTQFVRTMKQFIHTNHRLIYSQLSRRALYITNHVELTESHQLWANTQHQDTRRNKQPKRQSKLDLIMAHEYDDAATQGLYDQLFHKLQLNDTDTIILKRIISRIKPEKLTQFLTTYHEFIDRSPPLHISDQIHFIQQMHQYISSTRSRGVFSNRIELFTRHKFITNDSVRSNTIHATTIDQLRNALQLSNYDVELFDSIVNQLQSDEIDKFIDLYVNFVNLKQVFNTHKKKFLSSIKPYIHDVTLKRQFGSRVLSLTLHTDNVIIQSTQQQLYLQQLRTNNNQCVRGYESDPQLPWNIIGISRQYITSVDIKYLDDVLYHYARADLQIMSSILQELRNNELSAPEVGHRIGFMHKQIDVHTNQPIDKQFLTKLINEYRYTLNEEQQIQRMHKYDENDRANDVIVKKKSKIKQSSTTAATSKSSIKLFTSVERQKLIDLFTELDSVTIRYFIEQMRDYNDKLYTAEQHELMREHDHEYVQLNEELTENKQINHKKSNPKLNSPDTLVSSTKDSAIILHNQQTDLLYSHVYNPCKQLFRTTLNCVLNTLRNKKLDPYIIATFRNNMNELYSMGDNKPTTPCSVNVLEEIYKQCKQSSDLHDYVAGIYNQTTHQYDETNDITTVYNYIDSNQHTLHKVVIHNVPADIGVVELSHAFARCGHVQLLEIYREQLTNDKLINQYELTQLQNKYRTTNRQYKKSRPSLHSNQYLTSSPVYGFVYFDSVDSVQSATQYALRSLGIVVERKGINQKRFSKKSPVVNTDEYIEHVFVDSAGNELSNNNSIVEEDNDMDAKDSKTATQQSTYTAVYTDDISHIDTLHISNLPYYNTGITYDKIRQQIRSLMQSARLSNSVLLRIQSPSSYSSRGSIQLKFTSHDDAVRGLKALKLAEKNNTAHIQYISKHIHHENKQLLMGWDIRTIKTKYSTKLPYVEFEADIPLTNNNNESNVPQIDFNHLRNSPTAVHIARLLHEQQHSSMNT